MKEPGRGSASEQEAHSQRRRNKRCSSVPEQELLRVVETEHVVVVLDVILGQEMVDFIELLA